MKFHFPFALLLLGLAVPAYSESAAQTLEYQSAFEGYQAYSDSETQNWPKVNELVEEIGGWRVYAREPYEEKTESKGIEGSPVEAEKPPATKPPASKSHHHGGAQ